LLLTLPLSAACGPDDDKSPDSAVADSSQSTSDATVDQQGADGASPANDATQQPDVTTSAPLPTWPARVVSLPGSSLSLAMLSDGRVAAGTSTTLGLFDPQGTVVWQLATSSILAALKDHKFKSVGARGDNGIVALFDAPPGQPTQATLALVTTAGAEAWSSSFAGEALRAWVDAGAHGLVVSLWALKSGTAAGLPEARCVMLSPKGKTAWSSDLTQIVRGPFVAAHDDGRVALLGEELTQTIAGQSTWVVALLDAAGKMTTRTTYVEKAAVTGPTGFVLAPDGYLGVHLSTGFTASGPTMDDDAVLFRFDAAGKLLWRHAIAGVGGLDHALVPAGQVWPAGGAVVASHFITVPPEKCCPADAFRPALHWLDRWGNEVSETLKIPGVPDASGRASDVVALGVRRLAVTGSTTGFGQWIALLDAWGRVSQDGADSCAALSRQDCDDGDPCTRDWCEPAIGCTHTPWPNGAPCGQASACDGGKCKPAKP